VEKLKTDPPGGSTGLGRQRLISKIVLLQMLAEVEKLTNDCAVCEKKLSQPEPLSTDPRTLKLQLAQQRVCCLCFRLLIFSDQFYVCSLAYESRCAIINWICIYFLSRVGIYSLPSVL